MTPPLTETERIFLLRLARAALTASVRERRALDVDEDGVPAGRLREPGACFVTLTIDHGELRGCTGTIEPREALYRAVMDNTVGTALFDYRFEPVGAGELERIRIEISVLAPAVPCAYAATADLLSRLRHERPGVILEFGSRRATFLPQVWDKVSEPAEFLAHLCLKAGLPSDFWRLGKPALWTYGVEMFEEEPVAARAEPLSDPPPAA